MEFNSRVGNPFEKTSKANRKVLLLKIWSQKIKSPRPWNELSADEAFCPGLGRVRGPLVGCEFANVNQFKIQSLIPLLL